MNKEEIIFGLAVALLIAVLLSPLASQRPDGLERIAQEAGVLKNLPGKPDLEPNPNNKKLAAAVSGLAGTLLVFGLGYGIAALIKKVKSKHET